LPPPKRVPPTPPVAAPRYEAPSPSPAPASDYSTGWISAPTPIYHRSEPAPSPTPSESYSCARDDSPAPSPSYDSGSSYDSSSSCDSSSSSSWD